MLTALDETMLRRAMRVAMNGRGTVEPNPMVGCVLVKNETIIAEGFTAPFGGAHAEPRALTDCQARGNDPRGATAYVTLEPCCHTNKKTPPCAPRLIEAGIARVVIGCLDPNPDVDGKGVAMLRASGIRIDTAPPALAAEFLQLIAPFRLQRQYCTVKWAQSLNGYVAGPNGRPIPITADAANKVVHRLRTRCQSIVVGVGTVITDDPLLTVRGVTVINRPMRVVLDRNLRTPLSSKLVTQPGPKTRIVSTRAYEDDATHLIWSRRWSALEDAMGKRKNKGICIAWTLDPKGDACWAMNCVATCNTQALVEPGPTLAAAVLPWADRLWVFTSNKNLPDGPDVPRAATIPSSYIETGRLALGQDTLVEYLNRDAESFAAAVPSADFVLELERLLVPSVDTPGAA